MSAPDASSSQSSAHTQCETLAVDVIIPTHNRARLIQEKVRWLLELPSVKRVIVVADSCTDGTERIVGSMDPTRVELLRSKGRGPQAARNLGIGRTASHWIVILDDDDRHPDDFIERLAEIAREASADIVGAPWLNAEGEALRAKVARGRANPRPPVLDSVGRFPPDRWTETPWLPPSVLVRRTVFEHLSYDESYDGNYWREETDLFVSAARAGFKVVLTGLTYSSGGPRGDGGIDRRRRARYEWYAVRNNHRFLRKHGQWLSREGLISSPMGAEAAFIFGRARYHLVGASRARWRRLVQRVARLRSAGGRRP